MNDSALMDDYIGKCLTCDNDRTGHDQQCEECRNMEKTANTVEVKPV